jgi:hypothetical protein
VVVLVVQVP